MCANYKGLSRAQAAESAELQIASISQQYRALLMEREVDVAKLKEELHVAKEQLARQQANAGPYRAPAGVGEWMHAVS